VTALYNFDLDIIKSVIAMISVSLSEARFKNASAEQQADVLEMRKVANSLCQKADNFNETKLKVMVRDLKNDTNLFPELQELVS
jgi:hypothetical protein